MSRTNQSNKALRYQRQLRGWSLQRVANELGSLSLKLHNRRCGANKDMVGEWERGVKRPSPFYQDLLCRLYDLSADQLHFIETPSSVQFNQHTPEQLLTGDRPFLWNVPHQRNPFFTGREDLLEQLHKTLFVKKTVAVTQQALCGLGGIGKTQTVLEYAYRCRDEYQAVMWVKADSRENLLSDYLAIAALLTLPERDANDQAVTLAAINRWLQEQAAWLLVFDNADDLTLVRDILPTGYQGHILITTRAQAMGGLARRIQVEEMSQEMGALFLLRRAGIIAPDAPLHEAPERERRQAEELVRELGGLPLALDQAGAYMEEAPCSLESYVRLYRNERLALLGRRGGLAQDHPAPVATTWSLAFEEVQRANPAAADLLQCCAFLDPDAIPEELILAGASELGPVLAPLAHNPLMLDQAMGALWKYSLVRRNLENQVLSLHRLVQVFLQETMDRQTHRLWAERIVCAVVRAFPARIEVGTWAMCQRLLPQALTCAELIERWDLRSAEAAQLLNQLAYYLRERARYAESETSYQRALTIRERVFESDHLEVAQVVYNLGRLYFDQGRHAEAAAHYQRALAIRERTLGSEHADVARCLNSLALLYWHWGVRYDEAEQLYQRALPIFEQTLGREHPQTAHCWNNLALLHVTQEKYEEAEQIHRRVLAIREKILPAEHLDTAQTLQNLACLYLEQRNERMYAEAERLCLRSLEIREHLLGLDHPQVARALNNLALLYEAQGRYMEAEPLYHRALNIREQTLGSENPKTLATRTAYAALLLAMQRKEDAAAAGTGKG